MPFFNQTDIDDIKTAHKIARNKKFCERYASAIERELTSLENKITLEKEFILNEFLHTNGVLKTSSAHVDIVNSFDFSRVGGGHANFQELGPYNEYYCKSFTESAYGEFSDSYRIVEGNPVSRFQIWTSPEFLKKLARRLDLPENVYFQIHSQKIDSIKFAEYPVTQYTNELKMVFRFSK